MIKNYQLTCPGCNRSSNVAPNQLGNEFRQVRCPYCRHEWLANQAMIGKKFMLEELTNSANMIDNNSINMDYTMPDLMPHAPPDTLPPQAISQYQPGNNLSPQPNKWRRPITERGTMPPALYIPQTDIDAMNHYQTTPNLMAAEIAELDASLAAIQQAETATKQQLLSKTQAYAQAIQLQPETTQLHNADNMLDNAIDNAIDRYFLKNSESQSFGAAQKPKTLPKTNSFYPNQLAATAATNKEVGAYLGDKMVPTNAKKSTSGFLKSINHKNHPALAGHDETAHINLHATGASTININVLELIPDSDTSNNQPAPIDITINESATDSLKKSDSEYQEAQSNNARLSHYQKKLAVRMEKLTGPKANNKNPNDKHKTATAIGAHVGDIPHAKTIAKTATKLGKKYPNPAGKKRYEKITPFYELKDETADEILLDRLLWQKRSSHWNDWFVALALSLAIAAGSILAVVVMLIWKPTILHYLPEAKILYQTLDRLLLFLSPLIKDLLQILRGIF